MEMIRREKDAKDPTELDGVWWFKKKEDSEMVKSRLGSPLFPVDFS
jgi:hypothetical protein